MWLPNEYLRDTPLSFLPSDWDGTGNQRWSRFPNDYYFLYYGNNYSHPADNPRPQRIGQARLLWDDKNVYPSRSSFLHPALLWSQAPSNASEIGSARCKWI